MIEDPGWLLQWSLHIGLEDRNEHCDEGASPASEQSESSGMRGNVGGGDGGGMPPFLSTVTLRHLCYGLFQLLELMKEESLRVNPE